MLFDVCLNYKVKAISFLGSSFPFSCCEGVNQKDTEYPGESNRITREVQQEAIFLLKLKLK